MKKNIALLVMFSLFTAALFVYRPGNASSPSLAPQNLIPPDNSNWLPGFSAGFAGLGHADLLTFVLDNNGGFFATGNFMFANPAQKASIVHYANGQWTPLYLQNEDLTYHYLRQPHVDSQGNYYFQASYYIYKWDGQQFHEYSGIPFGNVNFLGTDTAGRLYVSGSNAETGPTYIAQGTINQFDGVDWVIIGTSETAPTTQRPPIPTPISPFEVTSMVIDAQNNFYFGGKFGEMNGVAVSNLVKWDGTAWTAMGSENPFIYDLELGADNRIYMAGYNSQGQGVLKYPNTSGGWVTQLTDQAIHQVKVDSQNQIYIAGSFEEIETAGNIHYLAKWNGTNWSTVGNIGLFTRGAIIDLNQQDQLYLAEDVFKVGDSGAAGIGRWDGTQWHTLGQPTGQGLDSVNEYRSVADLQFDQEGLLYAAGLFGLAGDKLAFGIAQWDGTEWQALGDGIRCQSCTSGNLIANAISSMALADSGNLYVTGFFDTVNENTPADKVAYWNGTEWAAVGNPPFAETLYFPTSLVVNSQDHLFLTVQDQVAEWDGTSWTGIGGGAVSDLAIASDDTIYAVYGGIYVEMWDGTTWTPMGGELIGVRQIVVGPDDTVYITGRFEINEELYFVLRWNGTSWESVGPAIVIDANDTNHSMYHGSDIAFDSAGGLYLTGRFIFEANGSTISHIARWDGTNWSSLGTGIDDVEAGVGYALAINNQTGQLFVGGHFESAGLQHAYNIASWVTPVQQCGLGAGGTHSFYAGEQMVTIEVTTPGTLDCVVIQQHRTSHPAASASLRTRSWWEVKGLDNSRQPAGGFEVSLSLPLSLFPAREGDRLCLQTETGWDCAEGSFTGQTVTRNGITQFGAWAIETTLFQEALPVVVRH